MARVCEVCGKGPRIGRSVSHAHNVTSRVFRPNLANVRIQEPSGRRRRVKICTRCLRSGKVRKAVS